MSINILGTNSQQLSRTDTIITAQQLTNTYLYLLDFVPQLQFRSAKPTFAPWSLSLSEPSSRSANYQNSPFFAQQDPFSLSHENLSSLSEPHLRSANNPFAQRIINSAEMFSANSSELVTQISHKQHISPVLYQIFTIVHTYNNHTSIIHSNNTNPHNF